VVTNTNIPPITIPVHNVWVGVPLISSNFPLAYYDGNTYNEVCNLYTFNTSMIVEGCPSVYWSRIMAQPTNASWYQSGNNIFFYFYQVNQSAVFRIDAYNSCGLRSYDFGFKSKSCNSGGGGCQTLYNFSPMPASEEVTITPTILAPCDPLPLTTQMGLISIYSKHGLLLKQIKFVLNTQVEIDVSNLKNGTYIVVINDGNAVTRSNLVVKH